MAQLYSCCGLALLVLHAVQLAYDWKKPNYKAGYSSHLPPTNAVLCCSNMFLQQVERESFREELSYVHWQSCFLP